MQRRARRRFLSSVVAAVGLLSASGVFTSSAAQDGEITIDQATLTGYAGAVDAVAQESHILYVTVQGVICRFHKESGQFDCRLATFRYPLGRLEWSWSALSPQFVVRTTGITLTGRLNVTHQNVMTMVPFDVPVSLSYNSSTRRLVLHVLSPVTVTVLSSGQPVTLGDAKLAAFFDATLPLSTSFTGTGGAVSGYATSVNVQLMDGSIRITGNVSFD